MKKLISLVLALALVLASCAVAFAADPAYKITVENTNSRISLEGKTYNAYKIFDAVYGEGTAVSYTISSSSYYYTNATAKAALDVYFDFAASADDPTTIVVTVKEEKDPLSASDARDLADALTDVVPATADGTATGETNKAEITVPAAGYYLVTGAVKSVKTGDTVETAVALVPVKDATAKTIPKADVPDLKKEITAVKEDGTAIPADLLDDDGKAAVAKVGSVVEYMLTSTVPDLTGYDDYTYTFTDAMSAGLTYNDDAKVYINGSETALDAALIDYTKNTNGFTLTLPYDTLLGLTAGQSVEVKYSATVNSSALTYNYEKNTAELEYSVNPGGSDTHHTPDQETYVIDINVDVNKYSVDPETGDKLTGAKFKLYKVVGEDKLYYKWDNNKVTWVAENAADVFETENGALTHQIRGLDQGKYFLLETDAPSGFNKLTAPIEINITATESTTDAGKKIVTYTSNPGTVTGGTIDLSAEHTDQPVDTIDVLNNQGTELPSTGGIGTTIFYILGGLLVVGAAVILVARRKAKE